MSGNCRHLFTVAAYKNINTCRFDVESLIFIIIRESHVISGALQFIYSWMRRINLKNSAHKLVYGAGLPRPTGGRADVSHLRLRTSTTCARGSEGSMCREREVTPCVGEFDAKAGRFWFLLPTPWAVQRAASVRPAGLGARFGCSGPGSGARRPVRVLVAVTAKLAAKCACS